MVVNFSKKNDIDRDCKNRKNWNFEKLTFHFLVIASQHDENGHNRLIELNLKEI